MLSARWESFERGTEHTQPSGAVRLYRSIGAGTCGTVFERFGATHAVKLSKPGYENQLWNDYVIHTAVLEAFKAASVPFAKAPIINIHIPKVFWFVEPKSGKDWWELQEECFPPKYLTGSLPHVLCTERILPIRHQLREAIIDMWCPDALKSAAKAEPANQDCLVRVYLGASRKEQTRPLSMFQL